MLALPVSRSVVLLALRDSMYMLFELEKLFLPV